MGHPLYDGAVMSRDKPPSPGEIEVRAKEYRELEDRIVEIVMDAETQVEPLRKRADDLKTWFVDQARAFGSAHAEKSKMLHGIELEAMVTFGQSNSIDAAAVETFRAALVKSDRRVLVKELFEKTVRWTLAANASAYIRKHSDRLGIKLMALALKCTVTKDKTPQLTVRQKQKAAAVS
jgi:hypothetical protein